MCDLDQLRRNVAVMDLLTRSYEAFSRGDKATADARVTEALEVDASVVSVLRGGMLIGEIPRPEEDFLAWEEYVEATRENLAAAEAENARPPCPECDVPGRPANWPAGDLPEGTRHYLCPRCGAGWHASLKESTDGG